MGLGRCGIDRETTCLRDRGVLLYHGVCAFDRSQRSAPADGCFPTSCSVATLELGGARGFNNRAHPRSNSDENFTWLLGTIQQLVPLASIGPNAAIGSNARMEVALRSILPRMPAVHSP